MAFRSPSTSAGAGGDAKITEARRRAAESDLMVVTTMRAWALPQLQKLVRELVASGTPVIAAAVGNPYPFGYGLGYSEALGGGRMIRGT